MSCEMHKFNTEFERLATLRGIIAPNVKSTKKHKIKFGHVSDRQIFFVYLAL